MRNKSWSLTKFYQNIFKLFPLLQVVNFFLNVLVYFTALYYLLANSGSTYMPVEALTQYRYIFGEGQKTFFKVTKRFAENIFK